MKFDDSNEMFALRFGRGSFLDVCLFSNSFILQASLEELVQGGPSAASSLTTYDEAALCSSAFR